MDDLVARLRDDNSDYVYTERHEAADRIEELQIGLRNAQGDVVAACARIQALETALAEAERRVIAEVVAWLRAGSAGMLALMGKDIGLAADTMAGLEQNASHCEQIATALETGEWKK